MLFRSGIGFNAFQGGFLPYPLQKTGIDGTYVMARYTDSASAATAWATGHKTDDGNIAWLPGDAANGSLKTIAEILRAERGFSIGVTSTVPFNHATPAAHVSHSISRNYYQAIANEIVMEVQPDVVIGGGYNSFYMPANPGNAALNYLASNPAWPFVFVQRQAGADGSNTLLQAAREAAKLGKKLFGLYGGPDGNFESPVPQDRPGTPQVLRATTENPLLKDTVAAALEVLKKNSNGFFVMFEQGESTGPRTPTTTAASSAPPGTFTRP